MRQLHKYIYAMALATVLSPLQATAKADEPKLDINGNKQCIMCHKKNGKMFGVHSANDLVIKCQNCHGRKEGHPRKASNLLGFAEKSSATAIQQVAACESCHLVSSQGSKEWTHTVHTNKVNCASCHKLHSSNDPMFGLEPEQRSQICAKCHAIKEDAQGE
ncbi:nitrite reductase [Shewanella sp. KX20019]|uniref:cytochrome c3 family protein n=1 Tax=Shewanella sp. KX20019 TaxID=2803864 RepID=UPI0019269998|nr:multiheme c-type cytochrome [Shewanella sp. KX20019]QQX81668.1 nitrite reductase [Shewanella sp. KX20019]